MKLEKFPFYSIGKIGKIGKIGRVIEIESSMC